MKRVPLIFFLIAAVAFTQTGGCLKRRGRETRWPGAVTLETDARLKGKAEVGFASYYGAEAHGAPTASGEVFDMKAFTAAHKTLPMGTIVRVTNLKNGKSVTVGINDRGPFVEGRIIDLSYAAANEIDMLKDGIVKVKVEIVK